MHMVLGWAMALPGPSCVWLVGRASLLVISVLMTASRVRWRLELPACWQTRRPKALAQGVVLDQGRHPSTSPNIEARRWIYFTT